MVPNRTAPRLEEDQSHGRGFRWIGIVAGLAVLGVAGVAALGIAFPGFVTPSTLAVGLTGTTIVLGLSILVSLVYLDRAFSALDTHHEAVRNQQQGLQAAREEAWERHEELTNQRFGERIDELRERLDQLDAEHASLAQQSRRTSTPSPFGDIHEVPTVQGIGEDEAHILADMGIEDTEQLWMANAKLVADHLGRDTRTVRRWQHQAELMALPSVGGRSAEILTRSGVHTIAELAAWEPRRLTQRLEDQRVSFDTEPEEDLVDRGRVESWIENARVHDPTAYRVHRRRGSYPSGAPA
jgi:predicted flap endonuclease-1-like 5' DNA nuclease